MTNNCFYLVHLLLHKAALSVNGHRYLLKLAVPDDDRVVVAGGDASAELLAVTGFKVLSCCHKDNHSYITFCSALHKKASNFIVEVLAFCLSKSVNADSTMEATGNGSALFFAIAEDIHQHLSY